MLTGKQPLSLLWGAVWNLGIPCLPAGLPGPLFPWPLCSQGTKTLCGSIAPMDVCVRHFLQATGQWASVSLCLGTEATSWRNWGEVGLWEPCFNILHLPMWWGWGMDWMWNVAKALQRAHRQGCVVASNRSFKSE